MNEKTKSVKDVIQTLKNQDKVIEGVIENYLIKGEDFGDIKGTTKTGKEFKTKPFLFKSGAEKLQKAFNLQKTFEILEGGHWLCIISTTDETPEWVIPETGAGSADDKQTTNEKIKFGRKRAFVDAIINTLKISSYFTQDEDFVMDKRKNEKKTVNDKVATNLSWEKQVELADKGELFCVECLGKVSKNVDKNGEIWLNCENKFKDSSKSHNKFQTKKEIHNQAKAIMDNKSPF